MSDDGSGPSPGGTGLWTAGAVIAILVAAGWFLSLREAPWLGDVDVTNVIAPNQSVTGAPEQVENTEETEERVEDTPPEDQGFAETATEPVAPTVDEVRVDDGGVMVVAGRAEPGSSVDILLDGEVVGSADVDDDGAFAAISTVPQEDAAQSLTLRSSDGDTALTSREEIIIAPLGNASETDVADVSQTETDRQAQEETVARASTPEDRIDADASGAETESNLDLAPVENDQVAGAPQDRKGLETQTTGDEDTVALSSDGVQPQNRAGDKVSSDDENVQTAGTSPDEDAPSSSGNDIALLRSDDTGVTLLQPTPAPSSRIILDTIGYNDEGNVQLSGRASAAAREIRVYLNNRAVAQLSVRGDGAWRGAVPGVEPGVYTLRLDALAEDGRVASRLETPFKREAPSVLAAAAAENAEGSGRVRAVTVQAGDTLWAIARERYGDGVLYVQVFEANRDAIRNPDLIYPGQVFDLPNE